MFSHYTSLLFLNRRRNRLHTTRDSDWKHNAKISDSGYWSRKRKSSKLLDPIKDPFLHDFAWGNFYADLLLYRLNPQTISSINEELFANRWNHHHRLEPQPSLEDSDRLHLVFTSLDLATVVCLQCKVFSLASNSRTGGPGPCFYVLQWQVAQLYAQISGSLFVAYYDSQGIFTHCICNIIFFITIKNIAMVWKFLTYIRQI